MAGHHAHERGAAARGPRGLGAAGARAARDARRPVGGRSGPPRQPGDGRTPVRSLGAQAGRELDDVSVVVARDRNPRHDPGSVGRAVGAGAPFAPPDTVRMLVCLTLVAALPSVSPIVTLAAPAAQEKNPRLDVYQVPIGTIISAELRTTLASATNMPGD